MSRRRHSIMPIAHRSTYLLMQHGVSDPGIDPMSKQHLVQSSDYRCPVWLRGAESYHRIRNDIAEKRIRITSCNVVRTLQRGTVQMCIDSTQAHQGTSQSGEPCEDCKPDIRGQTNAFLDREKQTRCAIKLTAAVRLAKKEEKG